MTDTQEKTPHGTYAEFDAVDTLLAACRRVRDAGYTKTDAYTPFPVHGIDKALGIKPTGLPWIVLGCGIVGCLIGIAMQVWMNSYNYPYIISGKPFFSIPAFIPVSFELTILLASFGAFFGMLALNRLPKFSNPVFTHPRFDRVTDDKFFLYIDAGDARFDRGGVTKLLEDLGGTHVQDVYEDDSNSKIPKAIWVTLGVLAFASLVPLLLAARMRVTTSPHPRFHVFFEMDFSPAKGPQTVSTSFADGRAMRADVPGTVAVGQFDEDPEFYTGVDMDELARRDDERGSRLVHALFNQDDSPPSVVTPPAADQDNTPWLRENPRSVSMAMLERGRMQFEIYCAACHGNDGRGNGLVNHRAQKILATAWVQPSSLHQETLYQDVYPDGKLFSVISNGVRKMGGYASQISVRDRWAVVAYVRALQQSQNASPDDIPVDRRNELGRVKAEVEQRLAEQAEAERQRAEEARQAAPQPTAAPEPAAAPAPTQTQPAAAPEASEPAPTTEPEPTPPAEAAPTTEPEPTPPADPEPTTEPEPTPPAEATPTTEPEPTPPVDPEPTSDAEPTSEPEPAAAPD